MARTGRFADSYLTELLNKILNNNHYLALFNADPFSVSTPTTVEIVSPVYARQVPTFSLSGRLLTCTIPLTWNGIAQGGVVSHIGSFSTPFGPTLEWAGPVPGGPYSFPNGGYLIVPVNSYLVGIDT